MSDPLLKTSEVLTGSSMQIKIPNGNIWAQKWAKNLGKMKYFPKLAFIIIFVYRGTGVWGSFKSLKKNQNAPRPPEHPPVRGKKMYH